MIRPIVVYPDPRLKLKSRPVTLFDEGLRKLVEDMVETMRDSSGLGLAAIQVGEPLDLMVMEPDFEKEDKGSGLALVNPVVVESSGSQTDEEGCLSIPDVRVELERPYRVKVRAMDLTGKEGHYEFEGILARCIFHELDHMNGQLFIERLPAIKRLMVRSRLKDLQKRFQTAHRA
jgi:peptide deformylase